VANDTDPYFWDEPDDPNREAELRSRVAARGRKFERLVDAVVGKIGWDKGDRGPVRLWLLLCVEHFEQPKHVQAAVRDWCVKVNKGAASLARLLARAPFQAGSVQSQFGFVYEDVDMPCAGDIAHLWKMAEAAEVMARGYRKPGRARRHDRDALIGLLADGFERLTRKRATVTNLRGVVTDVLAFKGEHPADDTVTGAVKRVLKTRRLRTG
jgi:hypothetical protein